MISIDEGIQIDSIREAEHSDPPEIETLERSQSAKREFEMVSTRELTHLIVVVCGGTGN
jgi:hypothetical protein